MNKFSISLLLVCQLLYTTALLAQKDKVQSTLPDAALLSGMKFRNIGPALMSGRIADIAIHPVNQNTWYVAVGSGGVWKTENSGTTWQPVFEGQTSYSVGCLTIDPGNPERIWVGAGENVGGRHVGYGDGVYRSDDGGKSWKNMGLKLSEHISRIVVHPADPLTVWVAAQGPLWSKGGERGVYKTIDGGKNWKRVLGDDEWTGATDLLIDPREPRRLYAATWQRHRSVAAYIGGGPGSAIYRSEDGGETWEKLANGLPGSDMGKIGLAISPQQPDVVYAAIELERRTGGVFRSNNRGAAWTKMSDAVAGGTGPHYYQELYASPHQFDKLFLVDVFMQVSENGGKTFTRMNEQNKHVDNHAIAFRKDDPDYILVGNDGGLYESFDNTSSWKFVANLPVTQFYKVAVDDDEPFYNVYGGTQDNNTQGGPSRTDNVHGIRNADWFVTLFGDGHQPATEPGNPNIVYSQWQQGNLTRYDRKTGEMVYVKPQPGEDEGVERFNWDAPILVSPHKPERLYFASQRVWRSEDRGDSWTAISGDLTTNQERIRQKLMDRQWSWDAAWDLYAMSDYSTITSLSESPLKEGLIWAGTDDGLIHLTEDGGQSWKKIPVSSLPGVPETAFVNDLKADRFDEATAWVVLDNHKTGDLNPYVYQTNDKGKTWKSVKANLPERTLTWRIVQDHKEQKLLFLATEFGIWTTLDAGKNWIQLKGGLPVIPFRDLAIQQRENDLVGASFGRGFFVLDDYSPLRELVHTSLPDTACLFEIRPALWYIQRQVLGDDRKAAQGDAYFVADNPPYGAVFTYYLANELKSPRKLRQEQEAPLIKDKRDIPFPGWDALENERRAADPRIWLVVSDQNGNFVQRIEAVNAKGIHRIAWDFSKPSATAIRSGDGNWTPAGPMAGPGEYNAALYSEQNGAFTQLTDHKPFVVKQLRKGSLPAADPEQVVAFWDEIEQLNKKLTAASVSLQTAQERLELMKKALKRTAAYPAGLMKELHDLQQELYQIDEKMLGNRSKQQVGEPNPPTVFERMMVARMGSSRSTYGATPTLRAQLDIASRQFISLRDQLEEIRAVKIPALEEALESAGAPYMEGRPLPK